MTIDKHRFFKETRININPIYLPSVSTRTHKMLISKLAKIDPLFLDRMFAGKYDIIKRIMEHDEVFLSESGYDFICIVDIPHYYFITKDGDDFNFNISPDPYEVKSEIHFTNNVDDVYSKLFNDFKQRLNNLFIVQSN